MPLPLGGERLKSSESFWPGEKEARRLVVAVGVGGGKFSSLDIWSDKGVGVLMKRSKQLSIRREAPSSFFVRLI